MNVVNWITAALNVVSLVFLVMAARYLILANRYTRDSYSNLARQALATAKVQELMGDRARAAESRQRATSYIRKSLPLGRRNDTRVVQALAAAIAEVEAATAP